MSDLLMLAILAVSFAAAIGYVWICVDLIRPQNGAPGEKP